MHIYAHLVFSFLKEEHGINARKARSVSRLFYICPYFLIKTITMIMTITKARSPPRTPPIMPTNIRKKKFFMSWLGIGYISKG